LQETEKSRAQMVEDIEEADEDRRAVELKEKQQAAFKKDVIDKMMFDTKKRTSLQPSELLTLLFLAH